MLFRSPGSTPVTVVAATPRQVLEPLHPVGADSVIVTTTLGPPADGVPRSDAPNLLEGLEHRLEVRVTEDGCVATETLSGPPMHRTLLVPYLRDVGAGVIVDSTFTERGVRFSLGDEWVEIAVDESIERRSDLPYGFESRRGLCGLVRIDLTEPASIQIGRAHV